VASVADLVEESALRALASDPSVWAGGEELAGTSAVRLASFEPLRVLAEVDDGGGVAEVELASIDDALEWTCTCADGAEGRPCRHLVAAGLVTWESAPPGA